MADELLLATVMVLATVSIHAIGLFALSRLLRVEESGEAAEHIIRYRGAGSARR